MKLKKGFTLIELLVVIAIIGILAITLAPKLREQLAKAKDSKAIAALGVLRTGYEIASMNKMVTYTGTEIPKVKLSEVLAHVDKKTNDLLLKATPDNPWVRFEIGGHRKTSKGQITYGGEVHLNVGAEINGHNIFTESQPQPIGDVMILQTYRIDKYSTEGKLWEKY